MTSRRQNAYKPMPLDGYREYAELQHRVSTGKPMSLSETIILNQLTRELENTVDGHLLCVLEVLEDRAPKDDKIMVSPLLGVNGAEFLPIGDRIAFIRRDADAVKNLPGSVHQLRSILRSHIVSSYDWALRHLYSDKVRRL